MSQPRRDPHARSSVQLTHEEIQVLKDCRVNSLYYRGIPLGLLSCLVAKSAIDTGYFPVLKRWSKAVYVGIFGLGLFTGIASYKEVCFRKIMALENSALKEQFLQFQKERGINRMDNSEFASAEDIKTNSPEEVNFQNETVNDSPLLNRMQDRSPPQHEDGRRQPNSSEKHGFTYEDLRKRSRGMNKPQPLINEDDSNEDSSSIKQISTDTYTPLTFTEDKSSRALDFSDDKDDRLSLYRSDDVTEFNQDKTSSDKRRRRNFPQRGRKNEYGDEME